ncbi:MAG: LysM peptidoglycan-binding domain-containing protein [Alphaproteobacteria bacterium]|nr:LysM peptidoglycan-binding domain-containing protein [Alphaproteobacteria bacterium]
MGLKAIVALVLLAGGLGLAYLAIDPLDRHGEQPAIVAETEQDDRASTDPGSKPTIEGSAARRMDDFGAGPSGITVTVPLRDRHRQAFSGQSAAGGGGPGKTSDKPARPRLETAALPPDSADGEVTEAKPSFRVIERDAESDPPPADAETPPTFDVVRVDPKGRTVMAGRAAPLTEVEIKAGDKVIDRVTTTATGEWVSTPTDALSSGDQELSLTALPDDAAPVESRQIVVVSIPETEDEGQTDQPVAVVVDKDEGGEGRILQAPDKLQSAGDERLALKLVDYDDQGAIRLSGEAPPGVPVRIYIDNQPAALVIGDSKGYWITTLDQSLPSGDYTLRLDQLDLKGQTVARLETPLTRVATPPADREAKVDYVIVQPGNSLWRIARRLSGDGFNYVYIYEANQAQIRDPDVIYPGQVFEVPPGPG